MNSPEHTRDLETILRIEVELAKQELEAALGAFWHVSAALANGGEAKKMESAVARENQAREKLILALHRLNEFLGKGKLPDTL